MTTGDKCDMLVQVGCSFAVYSEFSPESKIIGKQSLTQLLRNGMFSGKAILFIQ